jgi:hypothetical protein
VDVDRHTHAQARYNSLAIGTVERDHHGNTLPHFREIAARIVLGWEQRELTCRRHDDALHLAGKTGIAVRVDVDIDILPELHACSQWGGVYSRVDPCGQPLVSCNKTP